MNDRRRELEEAIQNNPEQSDKVIAYRFGISPITVSTLRSQLEQSDRVRRVDRDGKPVDAAQESE